jgi:vesicle coat complex subunit
MTLGKDVSALFPDIIKNMVRWNMLLGGLGSMS